MKNKKNILVVDDDISICENLKHVIESTTETNVILMNDGSEAYFYLRENREKIELILLDLDMPLGPGELLLFLLKSENNKIPVIIITGDTQKFEKCELVKKVLSYDFVFDVYAKPFDTRNLARRIQNKFFRQ